eukprot:3008538-Pyramimonas_sp.AAC.1
MGGQGAASSREAARRERGASNQQGKIQPARADDGFEGLRQEHPPAGRGRHGGLDATEGAPGECPA